MQEEIEKKYLVSEIISSEFGIVKLSLLRTVYLSLATNVLKSSRKI